MTDEKDPGSKPLISKNQISDQAIDQSANTQEKVATSSAEELFKSKPMPKMQSKKRKTTWVVPAIIGLLLIIAILFSGWAVYQQTLFDQSWNEQKNKVERQISEQSHVIAQAKKSSESSIQAANQTQLQLNQLIAKNKQLQESLLSTQERIKALSGRQKQDWMLAEAAYLIKAAQLQLSFQKDKATAIQLLKTADSRIIEIADNGLLPIREAIAKDLSNLNLILNLDITGIALALDAINKQIPSLNLLALQFQPLQESLNNKTEEQLEEGFSLDNIYQSFLKDFVVIKDHSEPVKPLMTSDQRVNLNNNIQLAIQQAQIALLQGNETLYQLNIDNAIQWTDEFFKHDESANQVVAQLKALKREPIEIHYPNQLNAQQALDEISRQQLYRWLESSLSSPVSNIAAEIIGENKDEETKPQQVPAESQADLQKIDLQESDLQNQAQTDLQKMEDKQ